jgi:hypothetical protein
LDDDDLTAQSAGSAGLRGSLDGCAALSLPRRPKIKMDARFRGHDVHLLLRAANWTR